MTQNTNYIIPIPTQTVTEPRHSIIRGFLIGCGIEPDNVPALKTVISKKFEEGRLEGGAARKIKTN